MKPNDKFIIGFGTGRCGTKSLSILLAKQPSLFASHEFGELDWEFNGLQFCNIVSNLGFHCGDTTPCDVAYYWINYLDKLIDLFPKTKAIFLTRNKKDVVDSWMKNMAPGNNFFISPDSKYWNKDYISNYKNRFFPFYDLPKREAVSQYYDDYHKKAFILWNKYSDNIKTFISPSTFNEEVLQRELLSFIGIPEKDQVIAVGVKSNASNKKWKHAENMLLYNNMTKEFKRLKWVG